MKGDSMKNDKKTIQILARFSKADAAALREIQTLEGRSQSDSLRFAVRTVAHALRITQGMQTQADSPSKSRGRTHVTA